MFELHLQMVILQAPALPVPDDSKYVQFSLDRVLQPRETEIG